MSLQIHPSSKLVMIGDSITDCGRARPVAEGLYGDLGNGYVSLIAAALQVGAPEAGIRVVNMGISGNTVRDLQLRWQPDVLALRPDWLAVMIGINDVWRRFDAPWQPDQHVPLEEYTRTLESLVATTRPHLRGLVLLTPYIIEPNRADPMRAMMDRYGAAVQQIAAAHSAVFVDTQAAFDAAVEHLHPMAFARDRIHPNLGGHLVLARAFLAAVGYSW